MKVSGVLLFILIFGGFLGSRCEATVYHSNGTAASVQSIHNGQAQNGDTITLPAGTFTWSTGVHISKGITLQGAGVGVTIIKDAVQSGQLIQWTLVAGATARLTGVEFEDGGRINRAMAPNGILHVDGSNTNGSQFRWDHCKWANMNGYPVLDTVIGVVDHNIFYKSTKFCTTYVYGSRWNDYPPYGDASWSTPTNFGTSQFLFFEDNSYSNNNTDGLDVIFDAFAGARFVVRHNSINNAYVADHGTESSGRIRGSRAVEVYNNTYAGTNLNNVIGGSRASRMIFHDNNIRGYWATPVIPLGNWRSFYPFPIWGGANGINVWDKNDPTTFFTGTAAANSSGRTVTVSGNPGWSTNQWKGYVLRRRTNFGGLNTLTYGEIDSSTSDRIRYTGNGGYSTPDMAITAGDSLEIRKVDHALDQPGRGQGSLIPNVQNPSPPTGWNDQVSEPCYQWNNGAAMFQPNSGINPGDYFDNIPMPGYTPYTYPHPLVTTFDSDGHPDYLLYNSGTQQTAIWYLNNNVLIGSVLAPTLPAGWQVVTMADFNRDGHPDYVLFNPTTGETVIWYMNNGVQVSGAHGPTLPAGWTLGGVADFNGDGKPDYLLLNPVTLQTVIWYMNNNVHVSGAHGPTLPVGWSLGGVADFNGDGKPDYLLLNPVTLQTVIWYMNNNVHVSGAHGPTLLPGWSLAGVADFNGDGKPDYLLLNPVTLQTVIWYMNNGVHVSGAHGPTLPAGWSLIAP
jgi:FG-GAP-like repeat